MDSLDIEIRGVIKSIGEFEKRHKEDYHKRCVEYIKTHIFYFKYVENWWFTTIPPSITPEFLENLPDDEIIRVAHILKTYVEFNKKYPEEPLDGFECITSYDIPFTYICKYNIGFSLDSPIV